MIGDPPERMHPPADRGSGEGGSLGRRGAGTLCGGAVGWHSFPAVSKRAAVAQSEPASTDGNGTGRR